MTAKSLFAVRNFIQKQREYSFLRSASNEEVFTRIYRTNKWGDKNTRSGKGSNLARTIEIRKKLLHLIKTLKINDLLDIPCGDFYWMEEIELPLNSYIGADIVSDLIDSNRTKFARKGRLFLKMDLLHEDLPASDAVLCRECLVHFSFTDIGRAIERIKSSNSRLLLTTHFPEIVQNKDILTGKHRPLNFERAPFFWPRPMTYIRESNSARHGVKNLAVWRISDLP